MKEEVIWKEKPNIPKNPKYYDKTNKKLNMKTIETYSESIRCKYVSDHDACKLRGEIYKLTPANIRKLCLNLSDEELSLVDKTTLKNYFEVKDYSNVRSKIKSFDIDGFRPICKFLKKENDSIASHEALELIAMLINFNPRPYSSYRSEDIITTNLEENSYESESVNYSPSLKNGKTDITVKTKNKKIFTWFGNASANNKLLLLIGGVFLLTSIVFSSIYILNNQTKWMEWQENHYVETKFDTEKIGNGTLKLYKEERIKYFKKITPDCNTIFFNTDGTVKLWYGKNIKKELEFFTDYGLHPETGKTLNPITDYMIKKYICDSYK